VSDEKIHEELVNWLLHIQVQNETSICANDPAAKRHIENLKNWRETILDLFAKEK